MPAPSRPSGTAAARTFRQGGALALGSLLIGACVLWVAAHLAGGGRGAAPVAWPLAFALAVWATVVRPSVQVRTDGVVLRNVLRDVHLPWPCIDLVETRWALTLVTPQGRAYRSWAITAQRQRAVAGEARPGLGAMLGTARNDLQLTERGASAGRVGALIRQGVQEWPSRVERGDWPAQGERVRVSAAVPGVVAVGVAIVLGGVGFIG